MGERASRYSAEARPPSSDPIRFCWCANREMISRGSRRRRANPLVALNPTTITLTHHHRQIPITNFPQFDNDGLDEGHLSHRADGTILVVGRTSPASSSLAGDDSTLTASPIDYPSPAAHPQAPALLYKCWISCPTRVEYRVTASRCLTIFSIFLDTMSNSDTMSGLK
ncbi:hypothetical protein Droror1_Dr00009391 [Drosera rotundifolia]